MGDLWGSKCSCRCWVDVRETMVISFDRRWGAMEACAHPSGEADDVALMAVRRGTWWYDWHNIAPWWQKNEGFGYIYTIGCIGIESLMGSSHFEPPSHELKLSEIQEIGSRCDIEISAQFLPCVFAVQSSCSFALVCFLFGLTCPFDSGCVSLVTNLSLHFSMDSSMFMLLYFGLKITVIPSISS